MGNARPKLIILSSFQLVSASDCFFELKGYCISISYFIILILAVLVLALVVLLFRNNGFRDLFSKKSTSSIVHENLQENKNNV